MKENGGSKQKSADRLQRPSFLEVAYVGTRRQDPKRYSCFSEPANLALKPIGLVRAHLAYAPESGCSECANIDVYRLTGMFFSAVLREKGRRRLKHSHARFFTELRR